MKAALCWIPTEVWVDVFRYPGKNRKELGEIVDQIGNRKFAEFLQFYLHEWGKRTLMSEVYLEQTLSNIPQTPMPENIKFFEAIYISHFDSGTLAFLRRISTLFLLNEVNLHLPIRTGIDPTMANVRTALGHLCPILHGIQSLSFYQDTIPLVQQYFGNKLAQIKLLTLNLQYNPAPAEIQTASNFALNWLTSGERASTEPRFLEIQIPSILSIRQFSKAIQQQFDSAENGCTFAIKIICSEDPISKFTGFSLRINKKNKLGEELHGHVDEAGDFRIYRHQPNAGTALQECLEEALRECRSISVIGLCNGDFTIGQIDENAGDHEVNDAGEKEDPSTSNN